MITPTDITVRIGGMVVKGEPGLYITMRFDGISFKSMTLAEKFVFEESLRKALSQWKISHPDE
jgi:hypothetical protein